MPLRDRLSVIPKIPARRSIIQKTASTLGGSAGACATCLLLQQLHLVHAAILSAPPVVDHLRYPDRLDPFDQRLALGCAHLDLTQLADDLSRLVTLASHLVTPAVPQDLSCPVTHFYKNRLDANARWSGAAHLPFP